MGQWYVVLEDKLMKSKRTVIGIIIGIIAAMLWSVVFINSLNSMAGIGIGICLGISFGISGSLIFSKKDKDKWWYNFKFGELRKSEIVEESNLLVLNKLERLLTVCFKPKENYTRSELLAWKFSILQSKENVSLSTLIWLSDAVHTLLICRSIIF